MTGDELISDTPDGELKHPDTNEVVPASFPYLLSSPDPRDPEPSRRSEFVRWMTDASNPYFATSYVNRLWGYMLGRGLIEPIDDIRAGNPPTHPELLKRLTEEFIAEGFDVRHVLRLICQSRTYQLSLETDHWNEDDTVNYSHAMARRLPAEVMYDAIHRATGSKVQFTGEKPGVMASELVDSTVEANDGFLGLFGRPTRESSCECARSNSMSLGHALSLVNGPTVGDAISNDDNELTSLIRYDLDDASVVEELFIRILSRPPSAQQLQLFKAELDATDLAALDSLTSTDRAALEVKYASWEAALPHIKWTNCSPGSVESDSGAIFDTKSDGSFDLTGEAPDKDNYTVTLRTDLEELTGLRLETWRGESDSGNYVLADLKLSVQTASDVSPQAVSLSKATSDFSQGGWAVEGSIDSDPASGWGIFPERDKAHQAVFAFKEPVKTPGGAQLLLTMSQPFGTKHVVGHFRFSVTGAGGEVRYIDLPDSVIAALEAPQENRSDEAKALLHARFMATSPEFSSKIRLSAARDIAWALINSPAFLYNR